MIFINKKFCDLFGAAGITLWPFIIISDNEILSNENIINHEKIHLKQEKELFVIIFYICYLSEWIFKRIKYDDWKTAYYNISFEKEAYLNECNLNYLKKRKRFEFIRYY